ncbi:hypothetical protein [Cellulosimicrobium cellulans]|uniref:hypothetical protein n=1 Tax=Cellulosimicrobium cellulans TaxID=1710 RepID=UPI001BA727D2|nr:hypothetical protein [Cellulosimicrobium cellulans]QUC00439.1 hypothetical protein J5A69_04080 [Cellulosimicrobium cellulans]
MRTRAGILAGFALGAIFTVSGCTSTGATPEESPSSDQAPTIPSASPRASEATSGQQPGPDGEADHTGEGAQGVEVPGQEPEDGGSTVTTLRQSGTTTPLVTRSAWQGVSKYGPCTLSRSTDPGSPDPRADQYVVSQELLSALRESDEGADPSALQNVLLPLTSQPGEGTVGVNAVAQDWHVSTPRGPVAVRGVTRAITTQDFEGDRTIDVVQLAFECPRVIDESAWTSALEDLRVTVPAQPEKAGQWPST